MVPNRVYITGPSGAGVSTLGAALAERLGAVHLDTDRFYWLPSEPPFQHKRPIEERIALIRAEQAAAAGWVLSGSLEPWGASLVADAALVVFLTAPAAIRIERLRRREAARHGAAIAAGGPMHAAHLAFLDWAEQYDEGRLPGRSRAGHEAWLGGIANPVLRLSGADPVSDLVEAVAGALNASRGTGPGRSAP